MTGRPCSQAHRLCPDFLHGHATCFSIPNSHTATTRRSPAAAARDEEMSGAPSSAAVVEEAPLRNDRRLIGAAIVLPPRSPSRACGVGRDGNAWSGEVNAVPVLRAARLVTPRELGSAPWVRAPAASAGLI